MQHRPTTDELVARLAEASRLVHGVAGEQEAAAVPPPVEELADLNRAAVELLDALRPVLRHLTAAARTWVSVPAGEPGALMWNKRQPGGTWKAIDVAEWPDLIRTKLLTSVADWCTDVDDDMDLAVAHARDLTELLAVLAHRTPAAEPAEEVTR